MRRFGRAPAYSARHIVAVPAQFDAARERHAYLEERLEIVTMEQAALVSEREADALVRATTARRPRLVHSTPG
jgi:hypothetical protein